MIVHSHILDALIEHARQDSPIEACGLLAGIGCEVTKSYRLTNLDGSAEHFSLDPKEQFAAVKDARALGLLIIGVYHSHPATPARMSGEDLRLAFAPGVQYVIVSLQDPGNPVVKSFSVLDGLPVEETIVIQELE